MQKIGTQSPKLAEIFRFKLKYVRNWPISKIARISANFEDIGVYFFANNFFCIVELNFKIKIGDYLQTKTNIFFEGQEKGDPTHFSLKSNRIHNSLI